MATPHPGAMPVRNNIKLAKVGLAADAGVDLATLQRVLEGTEDYPVSALAAIAYVLGLLLVLSRKGRPDSATVPQVRTRVQAALDRIGDPSTG